MDQIPSKKTDPAQSDPSETSSTRTEPNSVRTVEIESFSGFRLKKRLTSILDLESKYFLKNRYIQIDELEKFTKNWHSVHIGKRPSDDWATIGIIERVHHRTNFCVAKMTNIRGCFIHLFVLGHGYKNLKERLTIGAIVVAANPSIPRPNEIGSTLALQVEQAQQICVIGQSLDLARCEAFIRKDTQCETMIDRRAGDYCNVHITMAYKESRNSRMALASGNSDLNVRWAQQTTSMQGTTYKSQIEKKWKENTYMIKGKGMVTSDGRELRRRPPTKQINGNEADKSLSEFLKGRKDPGADMIRKAKGIKADQSNPVLSNLVMEKLGLCQNRTISNEEADNKKRAIESLKKYTEKDDHPQKKQRYVYL